MNRLIRNEWIKLFGRRTVVFLLILILLTNVGVFAYLKLIDSSRRVRWQDEYNEQIEYYQRQINRYPAFDPQEWENEASYQADLVRWQNQIARYQFCLENQIPKWDWRIDIVDHYYQNLLFLNCVRSGWNMPDIVKYLGFSNDLDLRDVEKENESLMVYVLSNDAMTYNKAQLKRAEQELVILQDKAWIADELRTLALAENDVAMWENYVTYQVAPYAKDQWKSLAIQEIHAVRKDAIEHQYLSPEEEPTGRKEKEMLEYLLKTDEATAQKDEYALEHNVPTDALLQSVYSEEPTGLDFFSLSRKVLYYVLLVFIAVLTVYSVCSEFRDDTLKQLVLYPYKRSTILHAKFLSLELIAFGLTVLTFGLHLVMARFLFPSLSPEPVFAFWWKGTVYTAPYVAGIAIRYLLIFLRLCVCILVTVLLSLLSRSRAFILMASMVFMVIVPSLIRLLYHSLNFPRLFKFVFFGNLYWEPYLENAWKAPYASELVSAAVVLAGVFLMRRVCYLLFCRRDIREN